MKIYIGGQITPKPKWFYIIFPFLKNRKQRQNILKFYDKANELKKLGHKVFNPTEGEPHNKSWNFYIVHDLLYGFEKFKPDAVYFMKNWEKSSGAKFEEEWAIQHNIKCIYEIK